MANYTPNYHIKIEKLEEEKEFVLMNLRPQYLYKGKVKTEQINCYVAELLTSDFSTFKVKINTLEMPDIKIGSKVRVLFDEARTKVYVSNNYPALSLWGSLIVVDEAKKEGDWV